MTVQQLPQVSFERDVREYFPDWHDDDYAQLAKLFKLHHEGPVVRMLTFMDIEIAVCDEFQIHLSKLKTQSRRREYVVPRQVCMYFMKMLTLMPLKAIGVNFGGRDHTTVIHACKTVRDLIDTDELFKQMVVNIAVKLGADTSVI